VESEFRNKLERRLEFGEARLRTRSSLNLHSAAQLSATDLGFPVVSVLDTADNLIEPYCLLPSSLCMATRFGFFRLTIKPGSIAEVNRDLASRMRRFRRQI